MKLTGDMKRKKRYSSKETFDSADTEGRYESLQSIERLLDNDVRELVRQRATTLPVLQVGGVGVLTRRRSFLLTDYMEELARARSEAINGLVPDTEDTAPSGDRNTHWYSVGKASRPTSRKKYYGEAECTQFKKSSVGTTDRPVHTEGVKAFHEGDALLDSEQCVDRVKSPIVSGFANHNLTCDDDGNVRRISVHDSDFQQFLGIRYLEICNKRQNDIISVDLQSQLGLNEISEEEPQPKSSPTTPASNKPAKCSVLNVKLLALARSRRRSSFNKPRDNIMVSRKTKLPPILLGQGVKRNRTRYLRDSVDGDDSKPGAHCGFTMPCSVSLQMSRRGVPCHAENRATQRQQTGRLHALLTKFRDLSSTTQKVEQEKLIDKLDKMND